MSRIDGTTIASHNAQLRRAIAAADAQKRARASIYDQVSPRRERGVIVLAIVVLALFVGGVVGCFVG